MFIMSETTRPNPILLAFAKLFNDGKEYSPGTQGSSTRTGKHLGLEYRFNYVHVLGGVFVQGTVENQHFIIHAPRNQTVSIFTNSTLEAVCSNSVDSFSDATAHRDNGEQMEHLTDFVFELAMVERRMDMFKSRVVGDGNIKENMKLRDQILLADIISRLLVNGKSIAGFDRRTLESNHWLIQENDWRDDHIRITQGLKEIKVERNLTGSIVIAVRTPEAVFAGKVVKGPIDQMVDNDKDVFEKALEMVKLF